MVYSIENNAQVKSHDGHKSYENHKRHENIAIKYYSILLQYLNNSYDFHDTVLTRIESFLTGRSQYVSFFGAKSAVKTMCGVSQRSVVGYFTILAKHR